MKVFIVEDQPWYRDMLCKICRHLRLEVVGHAGSVREATASVPTSQADLLMLDLALPDGDGFEIAQVAAHLARPPRLLIVSAQITEWAVIYSDRLHVAGF